MNRKLRDYNKEYDRVFRGLPKLGSPEYKRLLTEASASELPAPVLVRAFRELLSLSGPGTGQLSRAAEATLERLLATEHQHTYLVALRRFAEKMTTSSDWFDVEYLVDEAKGQLGDQLARPKGANAWRNWVKFQKDRCVDAWRHLNGREGRKRQNRALPPIDTETGEEIDIMESTASGSIAWHGSTAPDREEALAGWVRAILEAIEHPGIREVALDQSGPNPSKISSNDPNDTSTLAHRHGVSRDVINRWLMAARAMVKAALDAEGDE